MFPIVQFFNDVIILLQFTVLLLCIVIILEFYGLLNATVTANPECVDADNGATDRVGDNCTKYTNYPPFCGRYDDDDFISSQMCCACKSIGNIPDILHNISIYSY